MKLTQLLEAIADKEDIASLKSIHQYISPAYSDDYLMRWSCENGKINVVKYVLEVFPEIDLKCADHDIINSALKEEYYDIAHILTEHIKKQDTKSEVGDFVEI